MKRKKTRYYMWTSQHNEGIQNWGVLSGTDLKHAIQLRLERWATLYSTADFHPANNCNNKNCTSPDTGCDECDKAEYLTFKQIAEKIMGSIQYSCVNGDSDQQVTIWDITNPGNPILLLPCNNSISGVHHPNPKYKYEYVTIDGVHNGIREVEYVLKLQPNGTWMGDLCHYHNNSKQLVTVDQQSMCEFIQGKKNDYYTWSVWKHTHHDSDGWGVYNIKELYEEVNE